ncbi:MAG TPA: ATP-binding protein [Humisphaera sp.]|jgi:PAS domain S-box-containing protein|nr:ATP-binding protein [Humisphaera sp.]
MVQLDVFFLVAAVLQLAAMIFALRMIREANDRGPWIVLFLALFIMFGFRVLGVFDASVMSRFGGIASVPISLLLFISLFFIRRVAIAERVSAAAALRSKAERDESESRYGSLVELSPDAIFVSVSGKIVYANAAALHFFGAHKADDLIGHTTMELIAPSSRPLVQARLKLLDQVGRSVPPIDQEWLRLNGSVVPVESTGVVVPWQGQRGIQVLLRDVSERKRAEAEKTRLLASERIARSNAEHASRMKDEFLATLSHELRTPLNAILGWSQILQTSAREEADLERGLETIERNARAQTQLIEDLLDMSRIISGKLRLDIQRVETGDWIEAAIASVLPAAEAKGVRIEKVLDPLCGPVSGDPSRLQQVVWNLLSNAVRFTPRGGKIQVVLARVNSHIEISVADTGIGIKPEFLPFVFDRFRQADASTTRKHGGLGIGLAIVKQLVELHGGTVRANSPGEGHGATFIVSLPIAVVHPVADDDDRFHPTFPVDSAGTALPADLSGVHVLVVDDEPDARELIRHVLEGHQAQVTTAASAHEALEFLETTKPDVLVSDIGMPEVDGYEFLRRVRALEQGTNGKIPALALTAFARSEDRTRALLAGYQVHVAKPVEHVELVATVAAVAGRTGTLPSPLYSGERAG